MPLGARHDSWYVELRPASETRDICFLKVDVEGFELHAIPSAAPLFKAGRVHNVVVEFGPPNRWQVANNGAEDGVRLMHNMQHSHGFEPRLINSLVWNEYLSQTDAEAKRSAKERSFVPLDSGFRQQEAVDAMARCCEAYVWFTRDTKAAFGVRGAQLGLRRRWQRREGRRRCQPVRVRQDQTKLVAPNSTPMTPCRSARASPGSPRTSAVV